MRPGSPAASIHASNLLTYGSLVSGIAALPAALQGNTAACGSFVATAVILDTFDGAFARRIRRARSSPNSRLPTPSGATESAEMGAQLDSLVDAVTFGMVPVVCATMLFGLSGWVWWAAAFAYVACAVTRLGFYNVSHGEISGFVGLPTPVAGLFWSTLFLMEPRAAVVVGIAVSLAALMIAPLRLPRPTGARLALFVLWPASLLLLHGRQLVM